MPKCLKMICVDRKYKKGFFKRRDRQDGCVHARTAYEAQAPGIKFVDGNNTSSDTKCSKVLSIICILILVLMLMLM